MTRAWVLSGGASKGAFTAGVVQKLLKEDPTLEFKYAIGTSTGAIVAGPALLKDTDYLANAYTTMANSDILDNSFIGSLLSMPIDASMEPLHRQLIQYYLDRNRLQDIIDAEKTQIVSCVNVRTGKVHLISSDMVRDHQIKPATFVKAILASCSEPIFTEPVAVFSDEPNSGYRGDLFYDGGVKEFLPFEHAVSLEVNEIWGVSTHRLESAETTWGGTTDPHRVGIIDAVKWTSNSFLDEVARGDRFRADVYFRYAKGVAGLRAKAEELNVNDNVVDQLVDSLDQISNLGHGLKKLYLIYPDHPMGTSLEFNERIMMGYLRAGRRAAKGFLDNGKPEFTDTTLVEWSDQII